MVESSSSGYKDYLAGLLAGVATVAIGHPFDTVKVKLQKHNTGADGIKYRNGLHCTARILQTEGVCFLSNATTVGLGVSLRDPMNLGLEDRVILVEHVLMGKIPFVSRDVVFLVKGLYRGATSSFIGFAFESSLMFGIYSQTKQFLQGGAKSDVPNLQVIIPSAAYGGAIISFILCPTELVKCRMQVQGTDSIVPKHNRYRSPLDCALQTVKNEGVTGIFRGGCATLLRESVGNAVFFSVYENIRYHMHRPLKANTSESNLIDMGIGIVSGGFGGVACWCAVLPFDVAKTIIQTAPDKTSTRNPFSVLNSIYRRAGLKGCYTGLAPTLVRAFPANAAAIVTWELAMKLLGVRHG